MYLIYPPSNKLPPGHPTFLRFGNPNHKKPSCAQERHLGVDPIHIPRTAQNQKKRSEAEKTCKFPKKGIISENFQKI